MLFDNHYLWIAFSLCIHFETKLSYRTRFSRSPRVVQLSILEYWNNFLLQMQKSHLCVCWDSPFCLLCLISERLSILRGREIIRFGRKKSKLIKIVSTMIDNQQTFKPWTKCWLIFLFKLWEPLYQKISLWGGTVACFTTFLKRRVKSPFVRMPVLNRSFRSNTCPWINQQLF